MRGVLDVDPVQAAVEGADGERAEGADAGGLDRRRDAEEDDAEHEQDQQDRRDRVAQQAELLAQVDALFDRQRRPEARVHVAAHRDVDDVHPREQQPREDRADQQLAERPPGRPPHRR